MNNVISQDIYVIIANRESLTINVSYVWAYLISKIKSVLFFIIIF